MAESIPTIVDTRRAPELERGPRTFSIDGFGPVLMNARAAASEAGLEGVTVFDSDAGDLISLPSTNGGEDHFVDSVATQIPLIDTAFRRLPGQKDSLSDVKRVNDEHVPFEKRIIYRLLPGNLVVAIETELQHSYEHGAISQITTPKRVRVRAGYGLDGQFRKS